MFRVIGARCRKLSVGAKKNDIYSTMRRIETKEEANMYYEIVNRAVDEYVDKWGVRPSMLSKYLSGAKSRARLLASAGVEDVQNIDRVLDDVLEDREAMERDRVMTFESFSAGEGHERAAAEHCRTSLGHVVAKADYDHVYHVEDMGDTRTLAVRSDEDMEAFKRLVADRLAQEVLGDETTIHKTDLGLSSGRRVRTRVNLRMEDIVDRVMLQEALDETLDTKKLTEIMTEYLNDYDVIKAGKRYVHAGSTKIDGVEYTIWELEG